MIVYFFVGVLALASICGLFIAVFFMLINANTWSATAQPRDWEQRRGAGLDMSTGVLKVVAVMAFAAALILFVFSSCQQTLL